MTTPRLREHTATEFDDAVCLVQQRHVKEGTCRCFSSLRPYQHYVLVWPCEDDFATFYCRTYRVLIESLIPSAPM